jgi:uncharacterized protein
VHRERLTTPDGDFLDLDFGPDPGPHAPAVLVLHGLEGSSARRYVRLAMSELYRSGILPIGMNFRSCSGEPNLLARFYHSGETEDLDFLLTVLGQRLDGRPIGALGYSLGGNVLLRYLGERGADLHPHVRAAAAISVPYDLTEGTRLLEERWTGRVYSRWFLRSLQAKARLKEHILTPLLDLERVLRARTLREFDEAATAPLHGFSGAAEYYRVASSGPVLDRIRVPTLLLHALDDPFLPHTSAPVETMRKSPWLTGAFHPRGGHVGFVEGPSPRQARFWAETEVARYLSEVLREG